MKLHFHQDAFVSGELVYKKDNSYEIDDSKGSATRWITRGIATIVVAEEKIEAAKEKQPPKNLSKKQLEKWHKENQRNVQPEPEQIVETVPEPEQDIKAEDSPAIIEEVPEEIDL